LPRSARNEKKNQVGAVGQDGAQNHNEWLVTLMCLNGNLQTIYFAYAL
jgi:hypothetical protein